jgi:short-subunit dehydrogenase
MRIQARSYQDRVVWITGASSGIGAALAAAFAERHAILVLSARRRDRLDAVRTQCLHADRHRVVPLDLTDATAIPATAESVLSQLGRVDVLVNNGGLTQRSLAKDTRLEVDRRIMETNYFGAVALTKAVLPCMLERRRGDIVVVSSLAGHFSTPLRSAYAASKHALHGFLDALRAELGKRQLKKRWHGIPALALYRTPSSRKRCSALRRRSSSGLRRITVRRSALASFARRRSIRISARR